MKIVVIGGTGLVGPYLLPMLVRDGHSVICFNRRGISACTEAIACDRRDPSALKAAIKETCPQAIIDMVPYTRVDAEILCEVAGSIDEPQVIAVSSIDVYLAYGRLHRTEIGPYQEYPIKEDGALRKNLSFQGQSYDKLGIETAYLSRFNNLSVLRMPAIYGWPDQSRIKPYLDVVSKEDRTIRMNPRFAKWGFSRAAAQDCAQAIRLTVGRSGQNIYNVAEQELTTEEEWCRMIWSAAGQEGEIIFDDGAAIPYNADLNQGWHVDTSKIRSELGYTESTDRIDVLKEAIKKIRSVEQADAENGG